LVPSAGRAELALVGAAVGERGSVEGLDGAAEFGHHRAVARGRLLVAVGLGDVELRLLQRALRAVADVAVAAAALHLAERFRLLDPTMM